MKMQRHVISLPIPNDLKQKLVRNGIESVNELAKLKPTDLIKDFGFTRNELNELNNTIGVYKSTRPMTVYDLIKSKQNKLEYLSTLAKKIDEILGGGIPFGKITEICGSAGAGKTQFGMQLCVNVQIPENFNGCSGQAVYIDTEGSFISKRVIEIAYSVQNYLANNFNLNQESDLIQESFSIEKILSNIFYFRCVDHVQLISTVNGLKEFISKRPNIKLIVIDSLAYPFRFHDYKDQNSLIMKTNILNNLIQNAYQLIKTYNLAIVITNQMTTKITNSSTSLVPALGETWAHSSNLRLLFSWINDKRCLTVIKSSYLPEVSLFYKITNMGIIDEDVFDELNDYDESSNETNLSKMKKRRFEQT